MADREKVLKNFADYEPYALNLPSITMISKHYLDVLELLKEKEPVKPKQHLVYTTKGWFCGACGGRLNRLGKYCSFCGRSVKWE